MKRRRAQAHAPDTAQIRPAFGKFARNLRCTVGTVVIDDDYLVGNVTECCDDTIDHDGHIGRLVESRQNDGDIRGNGRNGARLPKLDNAL